MTTETGKYLSPQRKLVSFFERSRDGWKRKYKELKRRLKLAENQVRAVEKSRAEWRAKAEQAQQEAHEARTNLARVQAELEKKTVRRVPH